MTNPVSTSSTQGPHSTVSRDDPPLPATPFTETVPDERRSANSTPVVERHAVNATLVESGESRSSANPATAGAEHRGSTGLDELRELMRLQLPIADYMELRQLVQLAGLSAESDLSIMAHLKRLVGEIAHSGAHPMVVEGSDITAAHEVCGAKVKLRQLRDAMAGGTQASPRDLEEIRRVEQHVLTSQSAFDGHLKYTTQESAISVIDKDWKVTVDLKGNGAIQVVDVVLEQHVGLTIEHGTRYDVSPEHAVKLAADLGCDLEDLPKRLAGRDALELLEKCEVPFQKSSWKYDPSEIPDY